MTPLLLLHGALGAADQFTPLKDLLQDQYGLHIPDFSGHGNAGMPDTPFSIGLFARDVLQYMDDHGLEQANVFGYSMGGYVALYLARHHPGRVGKIMTLATKLHWDEATALREKAMLDPEKIAAKVPQLAEALQQRHAGKDWKDLLQRTAAMLESMGADNPIRSEDWTHIRNPVLLLLGDRDKMVSLEETVAVYRSLPVASMGMLPLTPHPLEGVNLPVLAGFCRYFFPDEATG